jgi:hypothetical protein
MCRIVINVSASAPAADIIDELLAATPRIIAEAEDSGQTSMVSRLA